MAAPLVVWQPRILASKRQSRALRISRIIIALCAISNDYAV